MAAARPIAVTNTSPVIALSGAEQLSLLGALFERLIVPFEVWAELIQKPGAAEPPQLMRLPNVEFLPTLGPNPVALTPLHIGEQSAIRLALGRPPAWVLLDDGEARRVARSLGLTLRGTLGILVEAKRQAMVSEVAPIIHRMRANGCWFSDELVKRVLSSAGEASG